MCSLAKSQIVYNVFGLSNVNFPYHNMGFCQRIFNKEGLCVFHLPSISISEICRGESPIVFFYTLDYTLDTPTNLDYFLL